MNSFQSLLNSYTKLRKRTYEFSLISEVDIHGRSKVALKYPGQLAKLKSLTSELRDVFSVRDIVVPKLTGGAFRSSIETGEKAGDVWETDDGKLGIKGTGPYKHGFDPNDEDMIKEILKQGEKTASYGGDADAQNLDPNALHAPSAKQIKTSANNLESSYNITKIADYLFSGVEFNFDRCAGSYSVPQPGNPKYQASTMLQMAIQAFFTGEGREFPEEALLEASEDIKELTEFLKTHMGDLEKGKCIQPTDFAKVENMRNKFFFRNNYLCYGNFQSNNMQSPQLVDHFTDAFEDSERVSRVRDAQELKSDNTPKKPFLAAYETLINDPSPCFAITSRQKGVNKKTGKRGGAVNPLVDIIDRFNKDIPGICGDEGPIFRTESSDTPTTLLADIAESSPKINWIYSQIEKERSLGGNVKSLEGLLGKAMNRIVDFALQKTENMDDIIKLKLRLEDESDADEAFMDFMYNKAEDSFLSEGSAYPEYANRQKAALTIAKIIALDYAGNGVSPTLRKGTFQGPIDIVMVMGNKSVNKMTGVMNGGEGVANTTQDTVVKADYAIKCSSREDVLEIFRLFDIDETSPDALMTLQPNLDGNWYVEVSDKIYSSSRFTSTGNLKIKNALYNDDIFNHQIASVSHLGIKNTEQFKSTCEKVRHDYKFTFGKALMQLTGEIPPQLEGLGLPDKSKLDRPSLDGELKRLKLFYAPIGGAEGKLVDQLTLELKNYDKDPESVQVEKLAHLISRVNLMDQQHTLALKDPKEANRRRVAESVLYSIGSMSSAVCISNVKHNGEGSDRCTNQDQRRLYAAAFNGDSDISIDRTGQSFSISDNLTESTVGTIGVRGLKKFITSTGTLHAKEVRESAKRLRETPNL